jgi:hypothetical protein
MAKLPATMIRRKKRPRKQLPAATSAAIFCTQNDTLPRIYRRPSPSLLPATPAMLQVTLPAAQAVANPSFYFFLKLFILFKFMFINL